MDSTAWLSSIIGPNKAIDTKKFCIICPNIPGSPYGSTYPLDINPETQKKYYYDFPVFTPRDIIDMFEFLRHHLHIRTIKILVGASMGGQLCFQWLVSYPKAIKHAIIIAADAQMSPWGIALHSVQQNAIMLDKTWGKKDDNAGKEGLKIARQIGVISYRSPRIFHLSQAQNCLVSNAADEKGTSTFENIYSYLQYQGDKFLTRFNTFSYWFLVEMMNEHDVSKGFENMVSALERITASILLVGINSDILFSSEDMIRTKKNLQHAIYKEISSVYGHDAFFIESKQLEDITQEYLYNIGETK